MLKIIDFAILLPEKGLTIAACEIQYQNKDVASN
jgi:hypothetical protein